MKTARKKSVFFDGWWRKYDCERESTALFIFGDNTIRVGSGGQAIIRHCDNSFGIPTKTTPGYNDEAYFNDNNLRENIKIFKEDINKLLKISRNYDKIYFPLDGLGTGLSDLQNKAPKTLKALNFLINLYFGIDYTKFEI
ncbi:MAG: hypothetical protein CMF62_01685 [Magnetococcales bacterium]|nr:hypothetical protein [Magnetococcales bacterium]|tara:strand:- start:69505 stop:69924 length:420 start_codon:yes stop_codon:yes gene_type:complete